MNFCMIYFVLGFRETILLVNVCNSLATGLIQPWLPAAEMKGSITPDQPPEGDKESPRRGAGKGPQAAASKTKTGPTIPAEALPDLKKAVEVLVSPIANQIRIK